QEPVRDLDETARAVRELGVVTDRATVSEVPQDRQALLHDRMRFLALDVGDEADAARVVLVFRVVQPLGGWQSELVHRDLDSKSLTAQRFRAGLLQSSNRPNPLRGTWKFTGRTLLHQPVGPVAGAKRALAYNATPRFPRSRT